MEFYEVINKRRTIRDFEEASIDDDAILRIVEAGMKAPTNDHMRDWQFIIIKDKNIVYKLIEKIPMEVSEEEVNFILKDWNLNDVCQQKAYRDAIPKQYRMLAEASCLIIPLFKQKTDIMRPGNLSHLNGFASIWCCIENIFLAIAAEGYASALRVPLGDEEGRARAVLKYPEEYFMPCFIAVGKAAESSIEIEQKKYSLDEVIHNNVW